MDDLSSFNDTVVSLLQEILAELKSIHSLMNDNVLSPDDEDDMEGWDA